MELLVFFQVVGELLGLAERPDRPPPAAVPAFQVGPLPGAVVPHRRGDHFSHPAENGPTSRYQVKISPPRDRMIM
jgi:hypothetical protein